jgi:hypothetical protein
MTERTLEFSLNSETDAEVLFAQLRESFRDHDLIVETAEVKTESGMSEGEIILSVVISFGSSVAADMFMPTVQKAVASIKERSTNLFKRYVIRD